MYCCTDDFPGIAKLNLHSRSLQPVFGSFKKASGKTNPRSLALPWPQQGLAPFLGRCRAEELSLVLLLDESLEKLPVEACGALGGIPSVSRDVSLHMLRHR